MSDEKDAALPQADGADEPTLDDLLDMMSEFYQIVEGLNTEIAIVKSALAHEIQERQNAAS